MPTFLLTWNPARWPWTNLAEASQQTADGTLYPTRWSTGSTKKIARGDRVFLLKQGVEPRGIVAAGRVTSEKVYEAPHYDPRRAAEGDTGLHADVEFDRILNPAENSPLSVADIREGPLAVVSWNNMPGSGVELAPASASALEDLWSAYLEQLDWTPHLTASAGTDAAQLGDFATREGDWRASVYRQIKARRGQQAFRDSLRERYGDQCMISGCGLMDVVEAAHIKPYRGDGDNHPANGLLLRADLHTLFDLDLIGIEPGTLIVRVHPDAKTAGYGGFDRSALKCGSAKPSGEALALRWGLYLRRSREA